MPTLVVGVKTMVPSTSCEQVLDGGYWQRVVFLTVLLSTVTVGPYSQCVLLMSVRVHMSVSVGLAEGTMLRLGENDAVGLEDGELLRLGARVWLGIEDGERLADGLAEGASVAYAASLVQE